MSLKAFFEFFFKLWLLKRQILISAQLMWWISNGNALPKQLNWKQNQNNVDSFPLSQFRSPISLRYLSLSAGNGPWRATAKIVQTKVISFRAAVLQTQSFHYKTQLIHKLCFIAEHSFRSWKMCSIFLCGWFESIWFHVKLLIGKSDYRMWIRMCIVALCVTRSLVIMQIKMEN